MNRPDRWLGKFLKLRVDPVRGDLAPHKPLLLLVLGDFVERALQCNPVTACYFGKHFGTRRRAELRSASAERCSALRIQLRLRRPALRLEVAQQALEGLLILVVIFPRAVVADVNPRGRSAPIHRGGFSPGAMQHSRSGTLGVVPRASCPCEGTAETAVVRSAWGIVVERAAGPKSGPCATFCGARAGAWPGRPWHVLYAFRSRNRRSNDF